MSSKTIITLIIIAQATVALGMRVAVAGGF